MSYVKEVKGLSQKQAIRDLKAIISSDYFQTYVVHPGESRISSDMLKVSEIGGWKTELSEFFNVKDLSTTLVALLNVVGNQGTLSETVIQLTPSADRLKGMKFKKELREEVSEDDLPLFFRITREGDNDSKKYTLSIINLGFKESYFEDKGLDFKDASKKLAIWYGEITRNLNKILPRSL